MKTIILTIFSFIAALFIGSCDDNTPGCLFTDDAGYNPDSLVIKSVLDIHDPNDSIRITKNIPFQSVKMEGVEGTPLVTYQIYAVASDSPVSGIIEQIHIKNDGRIEIYPDHSIPPGKYILSVLISNEGYSALKDSIFTLIVK